MADIVASISRRINDLIGRRLFGFDFFISYGRKDGAQYAAALEKALRLQGFKCFLDRIDMPLGQSLSATTRRGLSASRVLLLIATDWAMRSPYVEEEVRTFRTTARPIVAIDVAGGLERMPADTGVRALLGDNIWFTEAVAYVPEGPSDSAIASLIRSFTFTKQATRRQRWLWGIIVVLLILTLAALVASYIATQSRKEALARARLALSRQLAAESQTYLPVQPDLAALLGIEAYRVQDTVEARSALLAAVNERPRLLKTLPRLPDHPLCAALTRSGTLLAIGGASGTMQLWQLPDGKPVGENFGVADDSVWKLTFDSTGTMLITATDNAVRVWKLDGVRPVSFTLPHSEERMLGIDLSPDGNLLVAGGDDGRLYVWSMLPSPAFRVSLETRSKGVWALAFSPDGKTFAVGTRDGHILLYQSERLNISGSLPSKGHGQVMSMSFRPDGQALVAGYDDGSILVWSLGTHHVVSTIKRKGPRRQVTLEVAFSPDGKIIASGGTSEVVTLWNADTGQPLDRLPFTGSAAIDALLFTPNGQTLVAVQEDYGVIWDATGTHGLSRVLRGHTDKVWALAAAPLGDLIASGGKDATVFLWRVGDGRREDPPLRFGERTVRGMAFSPDGAELAVGYGSGVVALWRIRDHERIGEPLRLHTNVVHSLAFTPDGRYLATGSSDHSVAIFDLSNAKLIKQYWHGDLVNDVAISPDGTLLASSGDDNKIILWNLKTNSQFGAPIAGGSEATEHVLFSRDSKSLYWFNGKRIVSWKIGTPHEQRVYLQGHIDDVNGLDISPDGRILASATVENEVILWDLSSRGRLGRALQGHSDIVWKAVFASNGRVVASSSNDRTVRLWDVDIDHWIARACAIANRNLTEEEWAQYQQGMPRRPTCPSVQF